MTYLQYRISYSFDSAKFDIAKIEVIKKTDKAVLMQLHTAAETGN